MCPSNTNKILSQNSTFVSEAKGEMNRIVPAQDCSGFLYILSRYPNLDAIDPNNVINMTITIRVLNNLTGDSTTYTNNTDYDMDYYLDELIYGLWIEHSFTSGRYTIIYTVDGDNIDPVEIFTKINITCDCCLKAAIKEYITKECPECDEEYRKKFIKVYALSKAIELAPKHVNKIMLKRAIGIKDSLCKRLCNCENC